MNIAISINPENLIKWSYMEDWAENGTSAAPTEHTLTGASATVAQESTIVKVGTYSAKVTRVGTDCTLYHDYTGYADFLGRKMTFGAWVYATVASRVRISLNDGVTTTNSSYHSGGSSWEYLTVTMDISASATRIRCGMEVNTGNTSGYFDGGTLCEGDVASTVLTTYADISSWAPSRKYRLEQFNTVRRDGKLLNNLGFDDFTIGLDGLITGATATAARTNWDTVAKAINPFRVNNEQRTTKHDLFLYDDRYLRALISSFDHEYQAAGRVIKFKAKMTAVDAFLRSPNWYRSKTSLSASPTSATVTTIGTMYTMPILKFTAAGSNITSLVLQNLTTGDTFSYAGTVVVGNDLIIDMDACTVQNNGADDIANFSGDFMRLLPGANALNFTGTTGGTMRVDWVERYL